MTRLFSELRRRNVFRVAGVYTVVGWVLAQVATTLEETLGLPAWFDSLIVALLLIGLPIALVLAWAFELTPEGVVRTEDVPLDESITADTGHKLDIAIVLGLALLVGMTAWQNLRDESASQTAPPVSEEASGAEPAATSIAVLPFDDLSPESDQEYFSDGIAEEILNVLVGVSGLDVASRTSSFQFKGAGLGIPEIAAALDVRHVLEGSVRKSGSTIRVTAQLIDSSSDRHLWSETYDRPLTTENIFAIQDDIANAIVGALSDALGVGDIAPVEVQSTTRNLDAYEFFLQARPMFHDRIDLDVADQLLARAVQLDPEFAQAWEIRAALQILARGYGYTDVSQEEADRKATEFANRALSLESESATAIALLAFIKSNKARFLEDRVDLVEPLSEFDRALAIEPRNASALNWRGMIFVHTGDLRSALSDFETCMNYEPLYRPCVENHYALLGNLGEDSASISAYLSALNNSSAKVEFAYLPSLARAGEELAFKMATNGPYTLAGWRRHDEFWQAFLNPSADHRELIESIERHLSLHGKGYAAMFKFLALPIGSDWEIPEVLLMWDPMMHRYRQTPEFKNFIRASGVHDYWLQTGFPPQCRPVGTDDFDCD